MDKISIIIPVYNGESYLDRCITSLINQTYKNIEMIFLNDGSKDNSLAILGKYQQKDKRIIIVDKKNTGVSDTRNIGIDKASGKYICFCDCDDAYDTTYIQTMYDNIKKHNVDVVKCNFRVVDINNKLIEKGNCTEIANKKYNYKAIIDEIVPRCLGGSIPCFCHLLMIKKSMLKARFPLDIAMMEDVIFYTNLLTNISSMYVIDDTLYTIMYNPNGATNNIKNVERNIKNVISVNIYLKGILKEKNILNEKLSQCINVTTLNSISDFIFKHYLYSNEDTILIAKNIRSNDYLDIASNESLKEINIQRRIILKLIKNKQYLLLRIFMFLRRIIFKLRRR